uniref:Putative lipocalin-2 1 n=1 Tax=Ixodes ricinus TaxID=34613 RepID=V5HAE3_IXORI
MKLVSPCIQWCILATIIDATLADRRIDEEETYWPNQDIIRALENKDKKSWMLYRTLRRSPPRSENTCVYAEVKGKESDGKSYKFEQGYKTGDGTEKTEILYAFPYQTESWEGKNRSKENAMRVKQNKESPNGKGYQLIYSDYKCCDILRVLEEDNGAACELYLHDGCVSEPVPSPCASQYQLACGRGSAYKNQVYNESCRSAIEVTTKPSTEAPDDKEPPKEPNPEAPQTPEEATTTSTLPPGC